MKTILTLTMNPAINLSASVEHVFPDHKLRCDSMRNDPGGGGINVSRVIKRLGGESTAMCCYGGPTGEVLGRLLNTEGINHHAIPIQGWTRQNMTILESTTGQQYRFVMPGPILSNNEWQAALAAVRTLQPFPDLVVASGSLPPGVPEDFYAQLAKLVRENGGRLILDTSGPPLASAVQEGVFLIKPSLRELRALTSDKEIKDEKQQAEIAGAIVHSGRCEAVVVSLGAAGALLALESSCEQLSAPSISVCSKVGAGDSMVAGIVVALARGQPLRDAVRFGIATGTAAVMHPGTELCHQEDVEKILEQMKKNFISKVAV